MLELQPDVAWVELIGVSVEVPFARTVLGDVIVIKAGMRILVDGTAVSGSSFADESMVLGEPIPVEEAVDRSLVAVTANGTGALRMAATAVTTLSART